MKLLILFIAAASAVTIFPGEDSLAQESHGESKEHLRGRRTRFLTENSAELKAALSGRPRQHRKEENRLEHPKKYPSEPLGPEEAQSAVPSYFANILEGGGQKLGYSSFIQHHGEENEPSQEGSVEIKKVVPKSSVQVEMYHGPSEVVPQQSHKHHVKQEHKEVSYLKHKNKPAKYYQETISNYKKPKPSQIYISSTPGLLVKDLSATTPSYTSSEITKYKNIQHSNPTKRKPYSGRHEYKGHENLVNHKEEVTHRPAVHYQLHNHGEKKNPGWKALSETVEIASSNDYIAKQTKTRKPKQVIETSFASHPAFYDPEPERFKAERFDHEKALRGSTSFGISNAVGFGPTSDFGGEELNLNNFYNNLHSSEFTKHLETESAKGPVTFQTSEQLHATTQNFPVKQTVKAGNFQIPVMTEEEFEKHFGKIEAYRKPEPKFNHGKRLAFDGKAVANTKAASSKPISFSQFNSGAAEWAPHSQATATKPVHSQEQTNFDSFPAYSFNQPSRRNVSIVPERIGKVLSESHSEPQQYSVSASYQIDRNNGGQ